MVDARNKSRVHFEDPLSFLSWVISKWYTLWLRTTYPFASMGRGVFVHYTMAVYRPRAPRIKIGTSVIMGKDVWLNIIPEATGEVNIVIDDNCHLSARSWISAKNHIHLERNVYLDPSVLIMDHNHAYEDVALPIVRQGTNPGGRIRIEQGCSIGAGSAIICAQGELVLGHHSVVTPNSVVLRSVPPYSLVGGNPARVIEQFRPAQANPESPRG